jgi:lipooligosaccharide transport system permease protein
MAATSYMRTFEDFEWVTMSQLILFLFSATFYPLSTYPDGVAWVVQATPLYHGVALLRQLTLGAVEWSAFGHVLYLAALGTAGVLVAGRRLERRLLR